LTPLPSPFHTSKVNSGKNYLIFLLAVLAIAGGALAWSQHLQNLELGAHVADPAERADLEARNKALLDQNKGLQAQIGALQEQILTLTAQVQEAADQKKMAALMPGAESAGTNVAAPAMAGQQPAANDAPVPVTPLQLRAMVDQRYAALISKLNLTPEQAEQFKNLIALKMQSASDAATALVPTDPATRPNLPLIRQTVANIETNAVAQIQAQFGDAAATQYKQYQQTFPQRNTIDQLAASLKTGQTPLTDDQAAQMLDILTQTAPPMPRGGVGTILSGGMNYHSRITPQALTAAAGVLSSEQLAALQQIQKQQ
jgi:hypothetical protein